MSRVPGNTNNKRFPCRKVEGKWLCRMCGTELADTQIMLAQLCKIHPELPEAISQQRAIKMATAAVRFNFSETKPE